METNNTSLDTSAVKTGTRQVPVLSLKNYTDGTSDQQKDFVEQLWIGLREYGFIVLKDHNVSPELLKKSYAVSEKFYALPNEVKMKYAHHLAGQRGYTPFGKEHAKDSPVMDLKEFWHVGRQVKDGHPLKSFHPDNIWPTEVTEFQETFQEIYNTLEEAGRALLQALTFPLQVDIEYFDRMVQDGSSILRLLHYPPIPEGVDSRCVRAAAHEDINLITILPAATSSGLQLKDRDGQWLDIQSEWGDLIVDSGDLMARITNDVVPATTHRVINPQDGTNNSRYSMPFFLHPNPQAILSVIPSCKGDGAKYPDITAHDALMERLKAIGLI